MMHSQHTAVIDLKQALPGRDTRLEFGVINRIMR